MGGTRKYNIGVGDEDGYDLFHSCIRPASEAVDISQKARQAQGLRRIDERREKREDIVLGVWSFPHSSPAQL
jgi:hypothetical protein